MFTRHGIKFEGIKNLRNYTAREKIKEQRYEVYLKTRKREARVNIENWDYKGFYEEAGKNKCIFDIYAIDNENGEIDYVIPTEKALLFYR